MKDYSSIEEENKIKYMRYFHTFDAFRFLAFFLVFLHHLPIIDGDFLNLFSHSGGIGVQIFFVLSGFLISYILLEEKKKSNHLRLKNFFIRRILRIWPLYYAMVFFAFISPFILDFFSFKSVDEGYSPNWVFPILFLENYEMMLNDSFANVSPLRVMWSLCIEEHFYIVWGVLFYLISNKKFPFFLIISIVFSLICRIIYNISDLNDLDINTNILYFSIGGIVAFLLSYYPIYINKLGNINSSLKLLSASIIILIYLLLPSIKIDSVILQPLIIASTTALLLALTLPEKNPLKISDKNIFSQLGKYTYAMYLFHTIWINLIMKFSTSFLIIFSLSLIATIVSSIISYYLFENQFLKLKKYFR